MSFYPENPALGQLLQSGATGVTFDKGFLAHFHVPAASAVAADTDGIHAAMNLLATVQNIVDLIWQPLVPRNLQIVGNVAGITGTVTINGTNYAGEVIEEDIIANGVTPVFGAKAFASIVSIDLPIRNHAPVVQTETQEITHKADAAGTITVTVTSALLTAPKAVAVEVAQDDSAIVVATAIVAAMNLDEDVSEFFTASNVAGTSATVTLTAKAPAANDATLAMGFVDTDTTAVTAGASTNGDAGVPYDKITVGDGDVLGLPVCLSRNTVLYKQTFLNNVVEATEPTVTVSATAMESNTIDLNSALNGTDVDVYLIV